jgi:hypothetical protein
LRNATTNNTEIQFTLPSQFEYPSTLDDVISGRTLFGTMLEKHIVEFNKTSSRLGIINLDSIYSGTLMLSKNTSLSREMAKEEKKEEGKNSDLVREFAIKIPMPDRFEKKYTTINDFTTVTTYDLSFINEPNMEIYMSYFPIICKGRMGFKIYLDTNHKIIIVIEHLSLLLCLVDIIKTHTTPVNVAVIAMDGRLLANGNPTNIDISSYTPILIALRAVIYRDYIYQVDDYINMFRSNYNNVICRLLEYEKYSIDISNFITLLKNPNILSFTKFITKNNVKTVDSVLSKCNNFLESISTYKYTVPSFINFAKISEDGKQNCFTDTSNLVINDILDETYDILDSISHVPLVENIPLEDLTNGINTLVSKNLSKNDAYKALTIKILKYYNLVLSDNINQISSEIINKRLLSILDPQFVSNGDLYGRNIYEYNIDFLTTIYNKLGINQTAAISINSNLEKVDYCYEILTFSKKHPGSLDKIILTFTPSDFETNIEMFQYINNSQFLEMDIYNINNATKHLVLLSIATFKIDKRSKEKLCEFFQKILGFDVDGSFSVMANAILNGFTLNYKFDNGKTYTELNEKDVNDMIDKYNVGQYVKKLPIMIRLAKVYLELHDTLKITTTTSPKMVVSLNPDTYITLIADHTKYTHLFSYYQISLLPNIGKMMLLKGCTNHLDLFQKCVTERADRTLNIFFDKLVKPLPYDTYIIIEPNHYKLFYTDITDSLLVPGVYFDRYSLHSKDALFIEGDGFMVISPNDNITAVINIISKLPVKFQNRNGVICVWGEKLTLHNLEYYLTFNYTPLGIVLKNYKECLVSTVNVNYRDKIDGFHLEELPIRDNALDYILYRNRFILDTSKLNIDTTYSLDRNFNIYNVITDGKITSMEERKEGDECHIISRNVNSNNYVVMCGSDLKTILKGVKYVDVTDYDISPQNIDRNKLVERFPNSDIYMYGSRIILTCIPSEFSDIFAFIIDNGLSRRSIVIKAVDSELPDISNIGLRYTRVDKYNNNNYGHIVKGITPVLLNRLVTILNSYNLAYEIDGGDEIYKTMYTIPSEYLVNSIDFLNSNNNESKILIKVDDRQSDDIWKRTLNFETFSKRCKMFIDTSNNITERDKMSKTINNIKELLEIYRSFKTEEKYGELWELYKSLVKNYVANFHKIVI